MRLANDGCKAMPEHRSCWLVEFRPPPRPPPLLREPPAAWVACKHLRVACLRRCLCLGVCTDGSSVAQAGSRGGAGLLLCCTTMRRVRTTACELQGAKIPTCTVVLLLHAPRACHWFQALAAAIHEGPQDKPPNSMGWSMHCSPAPSAATAGVPPCSSTTPAPF